LGQIVASNSAVSLASTLLNFLPSPEARETVFVSTTDAGADPLEALDAAQHTIGVLFILCVFHPQSISLFLYSAKKEDAGSWAPDTVEMLSFLSISFLRDVCV
jgi:hypothetical protein